jgi:hypothetical protein
MRREKYKRFLINARAVPVKNRIGWSAEFDIEKHTGDYVMLTPFAIRGIYTSEDTALYAASLHGRKKIDAGFSN